MSTRSAEARPVPLYVAAVSHRDIVYRGIVACLAERPDKYAVTVMPSVRVVAPHVDVVLYDLEMMRESESELAFLVERTCGRVLALADRSESSLGRRALEIGAAGYVALDVEADALGRAVAQVAAGGDIGAPAVLSSPLSKREQEILRLVCEGGSNAEIAASLFLSANTLRSHLRSAYHKLGVHSRTEAVVWCMRNGLGDG